LNIQNLVEFENDVSCILTPCQCKWSLVLFLTTTIREKQNETHGQTLTAMSVAQTSILRAAVGMRDVLLLLRDGWFRSPLLAPQKIIASCSFTDLSLSDLNSEFVIAKSNPCLPTQFR
jgi:hypothetical protein